MTASLVVEDVVQYLLANGIDFSGRLKLTDVAKLVLFIRRDDVQSCRSILADVRVFLDDVDVLDRNSKVSAIDMEPILLPLVLNRFLGRSFGPGDFDTIVARACKKRLGPTIPISELHKAAEGRGTYREPRHHCFPTDTCFEFRDTCSSGRLQR